MKSFIFGFYIIHIYTMNVNDPVIRGNLSRESATYGERIAQILCRCSGKIGAG